MAANDSNTFQSVIDDANNLAALTAPLTQKVDKISADLDSVSNFLNQISTLSSDLNAATSDISDVQEVCLGLSPVPIVGELADAVADACTTINDTVGNAIKQINDFVQDTVSPANGVITDIKAGVADVDKALDDIADYVPIFTNTLAILQALDSIAENLITALAGSDLATRLTSLRTTYDTLRQDVEAGITTVKSVTQPISDALDAVAGPIETTVGYAGNVASAISSLGTVTGILDPIKSALDTVENAIAPVKWALDAVSCIFNKVLSPVINEVLEATGLQSLVDGIGKKLADALGISAILNDIEDAVSIQDLDTFATVIKNDAGSAASTFLGGWQQIKTALGKYSVNQDQARDQAIKDFVAAIAAAPAGSDVGIVPNWPLPPKNYVPPVAPAPKPSAYAAQFTSIHQQLQALAAPLPLAAVARFTALAQVAEPALGPLGPQWAPVVTMAAAVDPTNAAMATVRPAITQLNAKYAVFADTTPLASALGDQIGDITILLQTAAALIKLIDTFPLLGSVLTPLAAALNDQLSLCDAGTKAVVALNGAIGTVAPAVKTAGAAAPAPTLLTASAAKMTGWAKGAEMLARSIDQARTVKQTATSGPDLDAKQAQLNARCAALTGTLQTIAQCASDVNTQTKALDDQLVSYANALLEIATHGQLMSQQGQATADQVTKLVSVIHSLINPLTLIVNILNCTGTPMKTAASGVLQVVVHSAVSTATSSASAVQSLIDAGFNKFLPLSAMTTAAQAASNVLGAAMEAQLQKSSAAVSTALQTLQLQLQDSVSYTFPTADGTPSAPVSNQFLDATTGASTIALYHSLSA
ncbi:hypothetical protein [Hymenobacter lucidus]|uniref:Uncharacterized protein n=1 Tax=Hymenobacter lucidus TaxID=2880930 RepID=A0ABS8AMK1_9BACT|nr:hypothetical protein [Hymenobacter lucidus]MCB2406984.1 hypothetical protein [Hymenobacter lucidus]